MTLEPLTEKVLKDLEPHLTGGYILTGSIAYKLLLPILSDRPCKDTDVIIYPLGGQSKPLVDVGITNNFFVTRLFETRRGLQYSLVHKVSGSWVDLFPRTRIPKFIEITLDNGQKVKLNIIEEIAYGLSVSILEKTFYKNSPVLTDSIEKLKKFAPYVDEKMLKTIVSENIDQTHHMIDFFGSKIDTTSIIQTVLSKCPPFEPEGYKFSNYPSNQVVAPNGVQIENPEEYKNAMDLHMRYLEKYKEVLAANINVQP